MRTAAPTHQERHTSLLVLAACLAALVVPLLIGLAALRRPPWFPVLDLAMTELRVRDVGTAHTPLIGLPGRIGRTLADQGSHPGPLSFYLLAPAYRLFGKSAWALQAGTIVLHSVAMGASLVIARRRGGTALVLGVAAMLAVLTRGYGLTTLTEPWNPYMPLLWWVVFLLALWSVVIGDVRLLPVAVFAGSFCAQTHVPYVATTAGLGVLALSAAAFHWWRDPGRRREVLAWTALALILGLVLWTPPLIDQVTSERGNLTKLAEHFSNPPEEPVGVRKGVELALLHLDVASLASGRHDTTGSLVTATAEPEGSVVPGLALLVVWLASSGLALRMRRRTDSAPVLGLHVVVAAGLLMGAVSMSRIFGDLWYYLMLWAWGVTALLVVAVVWTVVLAFGDRIRSDARLPRLAASALAATVVVSAILFAVDATAARPPAPRLSSTLGAVTGPTASALRAGVGAADGVGGRYVITWEDALHIGSEAYGLVNELERRGFTVGMTSGLVVPNTKYRTIDPATATAEVHFATGPYIDEYRQRPDTVEVVDVEPRTPAEIRRFEALRGRAIRQLQAEGLDDIVPLVDRNLFGASIQRRVPSRTRRLLAEMLDLGLPTAVFIARPGTTPS
ncbi:MAG TPA: hypothetical protein VM143_00830 [Acidimicrobiales bacterium]|nr:hypothetical protein [Acidimicrobiales bacterium]